MAETNLPDPANPQAARLVANLNEKLRSPNFRTYRVRVGLAECTVNCFTKQEAIRLARIKIGTDMPRVRRLLYNIHEKEFRVDQLG